jgi:hypothetical protein
MLNRFPRSAVFVLSVGVAIGGMSGMLCGADEPNVIAPVRPNQTLTMNALLGFVNGEPVFVDTLLRPLDEQLRTISKKARNLTDFRDAAKALIEQQWQTQITDILITSSAKAALSEEDKGKLDMVMNKIRHDLIAKKGGSLAIADQALRAQGSSVEKELNEERRHLTVQLYVQKQIRPKIVVTRQMVLEDYERNPKNWQLEAELELYTITLPVSRWLPRDPGENGQKGPVKKNLTAKDIAGAKGAAMAKAREITQQLKAAGDKVVPLFAQLAEDNQSIDGRATKGGRTPNVKRGSLADQGEENYIFSLPANTIGEPYFVDDPDPMRQRVAVIRVGEKKEARTISFAEAQEEIRNKLTKQQYDQLSHDYMDSLYKRAAPTLEKADSMVETTVSAAVARYASQ